VDAAYRTSVGNRASYEIVHRLRMPDGRIKWVQEQGRTHYDAEGRPLRSLGTVQDISLQVEGRLRLRKILDGMQVFVALCDLEGHLVELNRAPADVAGLRREDFLGKPAWEGPWFRGAQVQLRAALAQAARGETVRTDLVALVDPGRPLVLDTVFSPLWDAQGRVESVIASAIDVTERRTAENAAAVKTAAIESSIDAIAFADLGGRITYVNAAFVALWGYESPAEALGLEVTALWEDRDRASAIARTVFERGSWSGEFTARRKDGTTRLLMVSAHLVRDATGHPSVLMGSFVDLSERMEAEQRVLAHLREKETLLREIHHRVKNNLQVFSGLLYFQAKKLKSREDAAALEEFRQRIFALALVHERLYQSSDVAHIDLVEYLRTLSAELARSYERRGGIEVQVKGQVPALPLELAQPIGLIVCELLTNTFKYAFPSGRAGKAWVEVSTERERFVLNVVDDGVGFPPGFSAGTQRSFGWELVRMLVQQLGGEVESSSAGGAHVRITFPAPPATPRNQDASGQQA
jgi:two-component system, sensor histidine kinase PdtaS